MSSFAQLRRGVGRGLIPVVAATALMAAPAFANGVSPDTVTATKNPGESFTVAKSVATPAIPPRPDVLFLADTTGSMGNAIANVRTGATSIMNAIRTAQPDSQFAVANYKDDDPNFCPSDPYAYKLDQAVTASIADAQAAINMWSASGGCDEPESQLNALLKLATDSGTGFRSGSSRIVVWFGDAPGHDPDLGATLASTEAALAAKGIRVIAISTGANRLNLTGQALNIATTSGGVFRSGIDDAAVATTILSALQNLPVTVTSQITCDAGLNVTLVATSPETITSGGTVTYTETVTVDPGNPGGVTLTCTVDFLLNGLHQSGFTETITVGVNGADVAVVKTGPALVTEGQTYSYTVVATNNGPATATGVTVSDAVPANTTFVSASPGCTQAAGTVTCAAGTLAAGASSSFTVTVVAGTAGSGITNTATVSADQADPVPANNTSTVHTTLNHNPVCTAVSAGPDLWPPNHKLVPVTVAGATDPDGNPLTYTVTGVTQDEPTDGLGDGDTPVDAVLGSGPNLKVRAERSGLGDGRVYRIAVTVSDGLGGSCTGTATVGVPHDQSGARSTPVDSGGVYNSLV
jgi:uncharacterized repeat protein (TIGR01451 family)